MLRFIFCGVVLDPNEKRIDFRPLYIYEFQMCVKGEITTLLALQDVTVR
ncbi:MAG: hypothetical protein U5R49_11270 [Deltaproteobacteria bacterium]|nr:hypothetical protein [Deltaproteobacteria bacterium]